MYLLYIKRENIVTRIINFSDHDHSKPLSTSHLNSSASDHPMSFLFLKIIREKPEETVTYGWNIYSAHSKFTLRLQNRNNKKKFGTLESLPD